MYKDPVPSFTHPKDQSPWICRSNFDYLAVSFFLPVFVGDTDLDMSSNAGQNPPSSKAINVSNAPAAPAAFHSAASIDINTQRRVGGSGSFGAGSSSRNLPTARNTQGRKNQHKHQRKPRLLDDDEYSESVGDIGSFTFERCLLTLPMLRP